ncbi:hypothetical protein MMC14_006255 [Varicellaria rhodocarpa]|nr:hypothetical protein [Varicellaria rhodocarpa]
MSSPLSKPLISVSPDNQGASVAVTNYVLLSLTIFVVVTRLITMCVLKRRPDFGDLFSIVAAVGCPGPINILFFIVMCTKHPSKARSQVLALLQSVIVQLAINHGLGRHRDKISSSNFVLFSKYEYAGEILVILVLVCAKISIALLIQRLTPQTRFVRSTWLVMMVVLGWGIFSVLGLAFQCGVHQPWISAPDKCVKNVRAAALPD